MYLALYLRNKIITSQFGVLGLSTCTTALSLKIPQIKTLLCIKKLKKPTSKGNFIHGHAQSQAFYTLATAAAEDSE
jgi:hypothetical protein